MVTLLFATPRASAGPKDATALEGDRPQGGSPTGDGGLEDSAPGDSALHEAVGTKRRELSSLLAFREGRFTTLRSADLFRVDLRSEESVKRRLGELRKELEVARTSAKGARHPGDVPAVDGGADAAAPSAHEGDRALLEALPTPDLLRLLVVRTLEIREDVLNASAAERARLLAAEQDAVRNEAARKERERTEHEAALAEEARLKALQAAQEARSNTERQLAEVRARVEAARGEQLRARADLASTLREHDARAAEHKAEIEKAREDVALVAAGSREADGLYDHVVETLVALRGRENQLLQSIESGIRAPRPEGNLTLPEVGESELSRERARLVDSLNALEKEADALESESRELAWSSLREARNAEHDLNRLRIALLGSVSDGKRERVLGFGAEGRDQGLREIARIHLELRWFRARGWETWRETVRDLQRPATIARGSLALVALATLLSATVFVRRRKSIWLRAARNTAARSVRRPELLRLLQRGSSALDAVAGELVTLGAVMLVPSMPGVELAASAWSVPYTLLLWYWSYRLALAVTHRTLESAASRSGVLAGEVGERILRSVRLVGRSAFFFAVLLASSAAIVGRGYLYGLVVRGAWLIAIPIGGLLVLSWRGDIADAYLRVRPTGTLSGLVSRTRTRPVGFFVVIAAFAIIVARALARTVRRFILGFEQSRKALAFFFRRRLERQVVHASSDRPLLAPEALSFFTERPVDDDTLAIDRFPGLAELEARFKGWSKGDRVGATLIVGKTGFGKTSWILAAQAKCEGMPVKRIALRERATRTEDVLFMIATSLGIDPPATLDVDELARELRAQGRQVITVDDAQLWFLRGAETHGGWKAFSALVERTSDTVLWIVAFAHYAWELFNWISKGEHVFRTTVHLPPWSEQEIGELLERRNQESGLEIVYDDLLVDGIQAGDETARILTTARDYNRLIWDYAEGSPRVALHVWGRSLLPDGPNRARVRLFMNPESAVLERLSESARFVLAAIVWHERLSLEEVTTTLMLPRQICEDAFERLLEHDIAEVTAGRLRITPRWWPVVVRYLRRKHLIET